MELGVDFVEEVREGAVAREAEHHAGVAGEAEEAAVPDADDDEDEEHGCAGFAEDVEEDLEDRLAVGAGDGGVEVLDAEEEGEDEEEAEYAAAADAHHHANRGAPCCVLGLFGEMGGGVETRDRVLGHEDADAGDVGGAGA